MRRVCAAVALALLTAAAPAHAAGSRYEGDCHFQSINQEDVTGRDVFEGVIYAAVFPYSPDHGNVVNATVTCELIVNGVVQTSTAPRWGSGAVVVAERLTFVAGDADAVEFCTVVDFTSDDTPTERDCHYSVQTQWPPQELIDWFSLLIDWVNGAIVAYVDPAVCQVLLLLAPGLPPHVTVDGQGDVFLGPDLFWDCPPYVDPQPGPPPNLVPPLPGFDPFVPTGGGYNTGDAGLLLLTAPESRDVASACAFVTDRVTGTTTVVGSTATAGAESARIRCRLLDTATGAVLYDETVSRDAPKAGLRGIVAANAGPVTVCTEGAGVWSDREVVAGPHCRLGEPLDRIAP